MSKVIGITGGIASGKSVISNELKKLGYLVIDTDDLAKEVMSSDKDVINELRLLFPECFIKNALNKHKLAEVIFYDDIRRGQLNNIVHPRVKERLEDIIEDSLFEEYIFIEVPLLYEAGYEDLFNYIIVVYVSLEKQIERLVSRDNISEGYAKKKIASQMLLEEKIKLADFTINNNNSIIDTTRQLYLILERMGIVL